MLFELEIAWTQGEGKDVLILILMEYALWDIRAISVGQTGVLS